MEFNSGACQTCKELGCRYLCPVTYTDDERPYVLWECINPRTIYWFEECPEGLTDYERDL